MNEKNQQSEVERTTCSCLSICACVYLYLCVCVVSLRGFFSPSSDKLKKDVAARSQHTVLMWKEQEVVQLKKRSPPFLALYLGHLWLYVSHTAQLPTAFDWFGSSFSWVGKARRCIPPKKRQRERERERERSECCLFLGIFLLVPTRKHFFCLKTKKLLINASCGIFWVCVGATFSREKKLDGGERGSLHSAFCLEMIWVLADGNMKTDSSLLYVCKYWIDFCVPGDLVLGKDLHMIGFLSNYRYRCCYQNSLFDCRESPQWGTADWN